jgi:lysozyme family protein
VATGSYAITAKAYGSNGTTSTTAAANITVTAAVVPVVTLIAPANGASFTAPATIALTATATTTQGTITKVEFYNGATLLGTSTTSPYSFSWAKVAPGSYSITAKAYGSNGTTSTTAAANITVTAAVVPVVTLTAPANGASFTAPATIALTATATTTQGAITKVEFYNGATLLGTSTTSPYSYSWANVAAGSYAITAKAYGSNGTTTTTTAATITVTAAVAPVVTLTAPANGASFTAPATIALTATATTTQGTITKVEFYNGATLLGTSTTSPYSFSWPSVATGSYAVTAKAYGSNGTTNTTPAANITVTAAVTGPAPVGRWPLDSVTGGTTPDTSGNNNPGNVTGPFTIGPGTVAQSIQLDPAVGGVLTQRPVIDPTKSFTVSLWVNLTKNTGTQTFVSLPGTQVSNFYLQLGGWLSGGFVIDLYPTDSTAASDAYTESTTKPAPNTWYHVTGVYDATAKQVRIYVNGKLENQAAAPGGSFANTTGGLAFGYSKWSGARSDGNDARIDDVRVFNSALSAADIQTVYTSR